MMHLGDITNIDWFCVEPADVVTGGSPCQDLSIAGKRAGLAGERSGLFMEQIRCVRELRETDAARGRTGHMVRPRFVVWENVPGAFSSNKGEDFRAVLEETIRIVEPEAPAVSVPEKGWPTSGCLYDDMGRWSVAWRVHDAQFWGVPQRRRRIALVADFGGLAAPEVLFERKGLRWDSGEGGETREAGSERTGSSAYPAIARSLTARHDGSPCIDRGPNIVCANPWDSQAGRVYCGDGAWHSLSSNSSGGQSRDSVFCLQGNTVDRDAKMNGSGVSEGPMYSLNTVDRHVVAAIHQNASEEVFMSEIGYTLGTSCNASARNAALCYDARGNGDGKTVCTLTGDHQNRATDYTALCVGNGQLNNISMAEQANTLDTMHDQQAILETRFFQNTGRGWWNESDTGAMIRTPCGGDSTKADIILGACRAVRRLTPLECERLQGFPDGWTDIGDYTDTKGKPRKTSDSARYRALGNSIALPFWKWLLKRISAQYERDATLGSLFDGIGGFPYLWEEINGKGSALWASEVEEFCIAVTKRRLGG